ncbi:MAG: hypothetical protein KDB90_04520 [Planctomycetes bacterium]|nr:hypothetical protein [Planctomycetota bacterium]
MSDRLAIQKNFAERLDVYSKTGLDVRATTPEDVALIRDLIDMGLALTGSANNAPGFLKDPGQHELLDTSINAVSTAVSNLDQLEQKLKADRPQDRSLSPSDRTRIVGIIDSIAEALKQESFIGRAAPIIARREMERRLGAVAEETRKAREESDRELKQFERETIERLRIDLQSHFRKQIEELASAQTALQKELKAVEKNAGKFDDNLRKTVTDLEKRLTDRVEIVRGSVGELAASDEKVRAVVASQVSASMEEVGAVREHVAELDARSSAQQKELAKRVDSLAERTSAEAQTYLAHVIEPPLKRISELENSGGKIIEELNHLKEVFTQLRAPATVAKYAQRFRDDASLARNHAAIFLCFGVAALVASGAMAIVIHVALRPPDHAATAELAFYGTTKLFLFALLATSVAVCVHGFRKSTHNAVVNEHRANALDSFVAFSEATPIGSLEQKALLMEAAKLIYEHRSTGFDSGEKYDASKLSEIVEKLLLKRSE